MVDQVARNLLNLEVLRETVFDGELLLKGTDLFYVHEVDMSGRWKVESGSGARVAYSGASFHCVAPASTDARKEACTGNARQYNVC